MIDTTDYIQAIFAGVCFYAAILHLIVGLRSKPRDRVHLIFAVVSLLYGTYSLGLFFLYTALNAGSLEHYLFHDKWGIAANYLAYASLFWFIAVYTQAKNHSVIWILTGLYVLIALSNYILPYTWIYTDIELTDVFPPHITLAPWYRIELVVTFFLIIAYTTYHTYRLYRRGQKGAAWALCIAVWIYAATYAYDTGIEYGVIDSVLLQQYGFLTFLVIMSLRLTSQVVEAEKEVRRLNIDLDHRVEARTAELSMANQDLIRARDQAQAADRAKSAFLANMSHELRTPLNTILGYAQIISRDDSLKPEQYKGIRAINHSGEHLLTLINNVLEMSKIEVGRAVLNPSPLRIDALISDMEMMFGDRTKGKRLELIIEKDPHTINSIKADRGKISQVLINLLSNAVRYTQNGSITLRLKMEDASADTPHLVFEVEDTGAGIPADDLEHIFDPFVQGGTGSRCQAGNGLGLAISRQYARMMNGDVVAESRVGQGSVFRFRMPVIEAESAPHKMGWTPSRRIVGIANEKRKLRVLVVDDEPSNRDVIVRMLSPAGFDICEATGGQEAIDLFESWSPHLILMDIRMQGIDGLQATKTIKSKDQGQATTIIGISASVFDEDREKVLESGADEFIAKPIQEIELWEKIAHRMKIDFLYGDRERPVAGRPDTIPLTRERVTELPAILVEEMGAAIQGGYMERLAELVKGAAEGHPELSQQLMQLVNHYDYETLSGLFLKDTIDAGKMDG